MPWLTWLNMLFGIWLIVSPWVLDFTTNNFAFWNAVLMGIAIVVVSAASLLSTTAARPSI